MPPVNDNLADAIELTGDSPDVTGTTVSSTNETEEINQGWAYGAGDVWYKWTAQNNGTVTVRLTALSMNGEFDVYTGNDFDTLHWVDGNFLTAGVATKDIDVIANQEYKIQVAYYSVQGTFELTISYAQPPPPIVTIPINCGILGVVTNQITGLDYLEGEIVSILADGEVLDQQVVQNGQITLPDNYAKVIVGLPYESDLETLNVELQDPEDTMQGKKIKIGNVTFRVINTRGGYVGPNENVLYDAFTRVIIDKLGSEDLSLSYTGDLRVPLDAGYEDGGRVFYKQKQPLPVSIGAIVPELKVGGATG